MKNLTNNTRRRQSWITTYRVVTIVLIMALVAMVGVLLARGVAAPSATESTPAVNSWKKFQRPSAMEYVFETGTCVVGGIVVSAEWHVGNKTYEAGEGKGLNDADYTSLVFQADNGRKFTVLSHGMLYASAGSNLGLELYCNQATMNTDSSYGLVQVIWGGM